MTYRNYIPEDFEQVVAICNEHKIDVPLSSMVFVAVDDDEKVKGIVGIKHEIFIEPLISDTPLVAGKLYIEALNHLSKRGIKNVKIYCEENKVEQFEKVGFTRFEPGLVFMQKEII